MKRLFISKSIDELKVLPSYCAANELELVAQSLIRFEGIPFTVKQPNEVLFFGSIRAVHFFLAHAEIPKGVAVACIGSVTAQRMQALGIHVDFIGEKSGQPEQVATSFLAWVGQRRVLIPCSEQSNRSMATNIPTEQCEEVVVYSTVPKCSPILTCDYYVFTSPSNLHAFLVCNPKPTGTVIAWGETTRLAMESLGLTAEITLEQSTEEELVERMREELR